MTSSGSPRYATLLEKSASIEQMAREKVDLSIITTHAKTLIFLINELANALEQERERLH